MLLVLMFLLLVVYEFILIVKKYKISAAMDIPHISIFVFVVKSSCEATLEISINNTIKPFKKIKKRIQNSHLILFYTKLTHIKWLFDLVYIMTIRLIGFDPQAITFFSKFGLIIKIFVPTRFILKN